MSKHPLMVKKRLRLDKILCERLGLSRREALRLLDQDLVRLNGKRVSLSDKGRLLEPGDDIAIGDTNAVLAGLIIPEPNAPLTFLAEGEGYVVADKPAGQALRPHRSDETGTLLNALVARNPQLQGVGEGGLRSGVVHRLDTDTSGVVAVATCEKVWQSLRAAFKEHRTTKVYRALVKGRLRGEGHELRHLVIAQHRPAKVRVVNAPSPTSRHCDLFWRTLETFQDATLLEVTLGTGFLHQIRVMFAHLGHPVIGDKVYGEGVNGFGAARQMLHAAFLEVEGIRAESPDPADFAALLHELKTD